ncbi:hypothetical protein [Micromonospora sp. HM5-17]|uniref:hypothetical protein n=1 Tax=Micromonospora sp. HM5-17 TaxID=2487710 RepID=UPI001F1CFE65|nr:hypothetical protein [Micromonospora sp. HM5-17]
MDDDDDCDSRSGQETRSLATVTATPLATATPLVTATPTPLATPTPTRGVQAGFNRTDPEPSAVPSQGGFGTYQASCGG